MLIVVMSFIVWTTSFNLFTQSRQIYTSFVEKLYCLWMGWSVSSINNKLPFKIRLGLGQIGWKNMEKRITKHWFRSHWSGNNNIIHFVGSLRLCITNFANEKHWDNCWKLITNDRNFVILRIFYSVQTKCYQIGTFHV